MAHATHLTGPWQQIYSFHLQRKWQAAQPLRSNDFPDAMRCNEMQWDTDDGDDGYDYDDDVGDDDNDGDNDGDGDDGDAMRNCKCNEISWNS
mgnify:CR=1 FL=1